MYESEDLLSSIQPGMAAAEAAFETAAEEFWQDSPRANVVGLGLGMKWRGGKPTDEPAALVLVRDKMATGALSPRDVVPPKLGGLVTDVLAVGTVVALGLWGRSSAADPDGNLTARVRPAEGGYSLGNAQGGTGSYTTAVYDLLPTGIGTPPVSYVLSCNHVLANCNTASLGSPILQPGPFDGGEDPQDRLATLSRFVPIQFEPPVPRAKQQNLVDAAVAAGSFSDLERRIYWLGQVAGWKPAAEVQVGMALKKTGRGSNFSLGRILATRAIVDVSYIGCGPGVPVARFREQIVTTPMLQPGDSGSLGLTLDNVAVGLGFAGSSVISVFNQIENVRNLLGVQLAERRI